MSWKTGPKTWQDLFGKVDDAICKITRPEMDQEHEWINLEEGNTELDLGLNLNSKDFEAPSTSSESFVNSTPEQKSLLPFICHIVTYILKRSWSLILRSKIPLG